MVTHAERISQGKEAERMVKALTDVYVGSDPTNDEFPPDDLFGPVDLADDPCPLAVLLYPPTTERKNDV